LCETRMLSNTPLSNAHSSRWCSMQPLLKVKELAIALRSTRHSNAFKAIAGRTIPIPNETRWNSWLTMIDAALALRPQVNVFVAENEELERLRLLSDDWHAIEETFRFLQPFREATKACEGDKAPLDQMFVTFDIIIAHLEASLARYADNKALSAAVTCGWYALDKYYRLTDDSPVYTAALLLHPSYRKHYLDVTWRREWIKPAVDNERAWWSREYADLEVEECPKDKPIVEPSFFEKQKALIKLRQRIGDEFDAFIQQAPIDMSSKMPQPPRPRGCASYWECCAWSRRSGPRACIPTRTISA